MPTHNDPRPSVFITGAAQGIGAEIAKRYAGLGFRVAVTDISDAALSRMPGELGDPAGTAHFYRRLDVTRGEEFAAALQAFAEGNGGAIDIMVNNAGVAFMDDFEKLPLAQHLALTDINVKGVQIGAHLALPYLKKSRRAAMINMCSISSEYGVPGMSSYSASKFWVKGFTEALNIEWQRHGIYVCDVMPNFVATPMTDTMHGQIISAIGIRLTAADIAAKVIQAEQRRGQVHWEADTWRPILTRTLSKCLPAGLRRNVLKRLSGY